MLCPYCQYTWETRTAKPKRCPRCQRWLEEWRNEKLEASRPRSIGKEKNDA